MIHERTAPELPESRQLRALAPRRAPTLLTDRLRLRTLRAGDFEDYAALNSDPEVMRYLGDQTGATWDRGRAWRHLAFLVGHWQIGGAGMWAVEHRESRDFLGVIGFAEPAGWPGFELAWTLARRFWGQGFATEGAAAALRYAFTVLRKERLIGLIHPENLASIRVAEKIGEGLQGRTRHAEREMLCYGLGREAYLTRSYGLRFAGRRGPAGNGFA